MKVILLADVRKLGRKGDTIEVSDGYGSNYLIPRGLAVASTAASQKGLAKANAEEAVRQKRLKKEAEEEGKGGEEDAGFIRDSFWFH